MFCVTIHIHTFPILNYLVMYAIGIFPCVLSLVGWINQPGCWLVLVTTGTLHNLCRLQNILCEFCVTIQIHTPPILIYIAMYDVRTFPICIEVRRMEFSPAFLIHISVCYTISLQQLYLRIFKYEHIRTFPFVSLQKSLCDNVDDQFIFCP